MTAKKKLDSPRHAVVKKMCRDLHKPRVTDETYCYETEPRDDHKHSSPNGLARSARPHRQQRAVIAGATLSKPVEEFARFHSEVR